MALFQNPSHQKRQPPFQACLLQLWPASDCLFWLYQVILPFPCPWGPPWGNVLSVADCSTLVKTITWEPAFARHIEARTVGPSLVSFILYLFCSSSAENVLFVKRRQSSEIQWVDFVFLLSCLF
eukprot:m.182601 g.182601  ORF g.182601 m.182601 type:complete len:124 (+) comp39295_c0_seq27:1491-1862(+)